ncbi:uncharacterized protein LOC110018700 isoform X2 [Phalaenopsis equestris]|uniref:uncharacterized protein LOC110018700 isoform X2 n=1 Tax=Phalaenopsis equestris TaxID=78828 RepID=UPI0009E34A9F|nr:uncharacterized protein LOC110018700 isoform X2 [Phalaenopsis equestris]
MALPTPASTLNILSPQSSSPTSTRAAVILPGLGNNSGDYRSLCRTLTDGYGIPTAVAKVSRFDWLRNAAGLVDSNYWRGTLSPRPVLNWYLERVVAAVAEAKKLCSEGGRIALIGHSAGGWLARVYMKEFGWPPPKGLAGVIDQTRGLLDYVEKHCAPAVYTSELKYVCIAGRYIRGAQFISNLDSNIIAQVDDDRGASVLVKKEGTVKSTPVAPTMRARFIGQGYKQVCGKADVWGDGVVPEMSAHLDGALNISLDGVYHSPVGSDELLRPWYGSPSVVQQWIAHLLN